MKIVITGTSGFIGSHLLQTARAVYGDKVTSFSSRPSTGPQIIYTNRADFNLTAAETTLIEGTDVLIHAGAFIPKCGIEADKIESCNSNIVFTAKLLALPWRNLKKIIFLSTTDVYTKSDNVISEATLTEPATLYGMSKLYCERIMSLYAAERGIDIQILRIGHVYGPGEDQYAKVIPKTIERIITGGDVEIWGQGKELRSFIFISDVVKAILSAINLLEQPGVINVVSGNAISIRDLLEKLVLIGGRQTKIVQRGFFGASHSLLFDNTKLKQHLLAHERDFTTGLEIEFRHVERKITYRSE